MKYSNIQLRWLPRNSLLLLEAGRLADYWSFKILRFSDLHAISYLPYIVISIVMGLLLQLPINTPIFDMLR